MTFVQNCTHQGLRDPDQSNYSLRVYRSNDVYTSQQAVLPRRVDETRVQTNAWEHQLTIPGIATYQRYVRFQSFSMIPDLPSELWIKILSYLSPYSVHNLLGVNRLFFDFAMDELHRRFDVVEANESTLAQIQHVVSQFVHC